jgi:carboxyl-terminal processing protease
MFQKISSIFFIALISIILSSVLSNHAWAGKRIALVIGNGAYPNIGELVNPPNDARLMAGTLRQLGFEVIEEINVAQKPMKKAIKAFGDRLNNAGKDAIGLFYYAGHGVQVNGENYLIPVNVEIGDEADVDIEAVGMRAILQNMTFAGNNMNIIVMDACRNNPFKRSFRSADRGLARMSASKGTLIAYATAPGDVAADGTGINSPYTQALTTNMMQPGITVERMFKQVRNAVVQATANAQVPWESSSLTGADFYFNGDAGGGTQSTSQPAQNTELVFWQSVQNSTSPADFEVYLSQYPNGIFAPLAKVKIEQLKAINSAASGDEPVVVASTGLNGFRLAKFKPKILSAEKHCKAVTLGTFKGDEEELISTWRHPETNGRIKITTNNKMIKVKWSGNYIKSNRELVQISGKSLLIDVQLKHKFGECTISFKLTDVLN